MHIDQIIPAVAEFNRILKARTKPHAFAVLTAWHDRWEMAVHCLANVENLRGATPADAFKAAYAWLDDYVPDEQRLAAVLGYSELKQAAE